MRPRIFFAIGLGAFFAATIAVSACRQDEPAGDPKTPANSPLPKIDKNDDDPKPALPKLPALPTGDAG